MFKSTTLFAILVGSVHGNNCAFQINSFTFVNETTKLDISPVQDYTKSSPNETIAIRANPPPCNGVPKVQSVLVSFDDTLFKHCELYTPYTVFRDHSTVDKPNDIASYRGYSLPVGRHFVSATPYDGTNCNGTAGPTRTKRFVVSLAPVCELAIKSFTIVNDTTKLDISPLQDFTKSSPNETIAIRANPAPCVGTPKVKSVLVNLDGTMFQHCEVYTPYTVFRDPSTIDKPNDLAKYNGFSLSVGRHSVSATPYDGENCTGVAGPTLTKRFLVSQSDDCELLIKDFTLVDVTTKLDISRLSNFSKSTVDEKVAIRADPPKCTATPKVQSVYVDLDDKMFKHCELYTPYTVFRDPSTLDKPNDIASYTGYALPEGRHTVSATPYSGENCTGIAGPKRTRIFWVTVPVTTDDYYNDDYY
jgi:hypothetical protein